MRGMDVPVLESKRLRPAVKRAMARIDAFHRGDWARGWWRDGAAVATGGMGGAAAAGALWFSSREYKDRARRRREDKTFQQRAH